MSFALQIPTPLQQIEIPLLREKGIQLFIKRDDLIHPLIQGNKWRKLKYNLAEAQARGHKTLLTFGGAWSNHIYATAAAAQATGFKSIGIIRGEEPPVLSSTLRFALSRGMKLHFVSRTAYADKQALTEELSRQLGDFYTIPEGGTNMFALKGVAEIIAETGTDFDYYCVAVGTGGTMAGIVAALDGRESVIGFSSLKGADTLTATINGLIGEYTGEHYENFTLNFDYHFGGYAKVQPELIDFIKQFGHDTGVPLEPVYTGKMFYGVLDMIKKGFFRKGTRILAIHTGGLQGLAGFKEFISV